MQKKKGFRGAAGIEQDQQGGWARGRVVQRWLGGESMLTCPFTHKLTHSYSLTQSVSRSLTHSLTHGRTDSPTAADAHAFVVQTRERLRFFQSFTAAHAV